MNKERWAYVKPECEATTCQTECHLLDASGNAGTIGGGPTYGEANAKYLGTMKRKKRNQ